MKKSMAISCLVLLGFLNTVNTVNASEIYAKYIYNKNNKTISDGSNGYELGVNLDLPYGFFVTGAGGISTQTQTLSQVSVLSHKHEIDIHNKWYNYGMGYQIANNDLTYFALVEQKQFKTDLKNLKSISGSDLIYQTGFKTAINNSIDARVTVKYTDTFIADFKLAFNIYENLNWITEYSLNQDFYELSAGFNLTF